MDLTNAPSKIQIPFANATTYKYTIPVASQVGTDVRKASYTDGFPPLTMEPISSGGVAPYGQDFNGVLNQLSSGLLWEQSNTPFKFDSEFCTSIGGYPLGAKLLSAGNTHYWINQVADNTANPDTIGTNWVAGESISTGAFPNADKWTNARTFSFTGDVTGSGSVDGSGNVSFAMTGVQAAKWATPRTITLSGSASGSASIDGSSNITIPTSITATSNISIVTGTIAHGGTIPLPSGYSESQCSWFVSINQQITALSTAGSDDHEYLVCTTSGRLVSCYISSINDPSTVKSSGVANYIIIGVK